MADELREEFGRPAMNRRILYRLSTAPRHELASLGLTPNDVREAAAPGITDAAGFLTAKRALRRSKGELFSG
ncbi:hypothetical protein [Methylobacterium komagatae]